MGEKTEARDKERKKSQYTSGCFQWRYWSTWVGMTGASPNGVLGDEPWVAVRPPKQTTSVHSSRLASKLLAKGRVQTERCTSGPSASSTTGPRSKAYLGSQRAVSV